MYPYRLQNFHVLHNSDKIKRLQFARHCQSQLEGYSENLSKIFFSDECILRLNCSVTKQNDNTKLRLNVLEKVRDCHMESIFAQ